MVKIFTILVVFTTAAFGTPLKGESGVHKYTFFEASSNTHVQLNVIADNHDLYVPFSELTNAFQITRKSLPSGNVGVCVADLCVPMQTGEKTEKIKVIDGTEYVPLGSFLDAITAQYVRSENKETFIFDVSSRQNESNEGFDSPQDFSLPTMTGEEVQLSDYRGKKVILFAWASW